MIKSIYFPGKEYATKELLFADLRVNAEKIIAIKKATIYESEKKGALVTSFVDITKIASDVTKVGPHMKDGYIYPVINTTNYLDGHRDVHFDGTFKKSAKEQNGKLFYVADHKMETDKIIAWPSDVNVMLKSIPWAAVGKDYAGMTEGLIYEIDKNKIVNKTAAQIITEKRPVQNSVRMQYVTIRLAMNSDNPNDKEYKAYFDSKIELIANKDLALSDGYFFGVEEAKIVTEGSMVPLGSNDATSIMSKELELAGTSTSAIIEPPVGTQKQKSIFSQLIFQK